MISYEKIKRQAVLTWKGQKRRGSAVLKGTEDTDDMEPWKQKKKEKEQSKDSPHQDMYGCPCRTDAYTRSAVLCGRKPEKS